MEKTPPFIHGDLEKLTNRLNECTIEEVTSDKIIKPWRHIDPGTDQVVKHSGASCVSD
jgi:hypothetical protein